MPAIATEAIDLQAHDWKQDAACHGLPPRDYDPFFANPNAGESYEFAKAVCAGCLTREPCLEFALATEIPSARWGVWGGTDPRERQAIYAARTSQRGAA